MNMRELGWTFGELAGTILRLLFMGSTLLFLYLIAEDIHAIREHQVPSELDNLLDRHNRIIDSITKGQP